MTDTISDQPLVAIDPAWPRVSLADATAALTAPGSKFEMDMATIRGIPTRVWKHAPADLEREDRDELLEPEEVPGRLRGVRRPLGVGRLLERGRRDEAQALLDGTPPDGIAIVPGLLDWAREVAPLMLEQYPELAAQHVERWLGGRADFLKA